MDISAITIAGLTVYEIVWFFMIYSFLGWVLEVIYHAVSIGKVVNRGFLNGPVCPIYGFGMIFILMLLNLIFPGGAAKAHGAALFAFGIVIATSIELLGGWALDKIFHARWWDYSDKPFNLNGYICPEFSFYWGIGTVLAVRVLHPFVADTTVNIWPKQIAWPVAIVLCCAYAADTVVTVMIVNGLNKELAELDDLRSSMRKVSDDLSNVLGTTSIKTIQRMEEGRVKAELAKEDLLDQAEETRDEVLKQIQPLLEKKEKIQSEEDALFEKILKGRVFGPRRLLKAFPDIKVHDHPSALIDDIKKRLE